MIRKMLLIQSIRVQNANALSSPYTVGFPAMTAWLGAVHALQRQLVQQGFGNLRFRAVGVVTHDSDLQLYRGPSDYVSSIIGTGNPLDKDGKRSSFIEEARIHMDVSIVIEMEGLGKRDERNGFVETVEKTLLGRMKLAGGDILGISGVEIVRVDDEDVSETKRFMAKVMPGYAVIDRRDLMIEAMEADRNALDAMIEYLAIHHRCEEGRWISERKSDGWIVPLAVGFHGLSEPGKALNQRDAETPHRFAESVVTLGEFVMPFRLNHIDELLWRYKYDEENALYLCEPIKTKQEGK